LTVASETRLCLAVSGRPTVHVTRRGTQRSRLATRLPDPSTATGTEAGGTSQRGPLLVQPQGRRAASTRSAPRGGRGALRPSRQSGPTAEHWLRPRRPAPRHRAPGRDQGRACRIGRPGGQRRAAVHCGRRRRLDAVGRRPSGSGTGALGQACPRRGARPRSTIGTRVRHRAFHRRTAQEDVRSWRCATRRATRASGAPRQRCAGWAGFSTQRSGARSTRRGVS
jgi:hypothetical protein